MSIYEECSIEALWNTRDSCLKSLSPNQSIKAREAAFKVLAKVNAELKRRKEMKYGQEIQHIADSSQGKCK